MKKILTAMLFTCLLVCSGHVYSHDIGVKKTYNIENTIAPAEYNSVVSVMNYETVFENENQVSFIYLLKSNPEFTGKCVEFDLKTYRDNSITYIITSDRKTNITYALVPDKLYLEDSKLKYPIVLASPLPKSFLLPPKNQVWCFGSNQRNC